MLLLFLLSSLSISNSVDVAVLSIKRLHTNPTIQWYTTMNDSIVTITLVGPADRWFGIGIGNTVMDSTYTFVVDGDGTLTERKLGPHSAGDILPTAATDLEYNETALNGVRTVEITRSRTGYSHLFYTFPNGRSTVGIIAAWSPQPGTGLPFGWSHNRTTRLSSTIDFLLGNETTPDPTAAPTWTPSVTPTDGPTSYPTNSPSLIPTVPPSVSPTEPSKTPSSAPTMAPSELPSSVPSKYPSIAPTDYPTDIPSTTPSLSPSKVPSEFPSSRPTNMPSQVPIKTPSASPTDHPTNVPTGTSETAKQTSSPSENVKDNEANSVQLCFAMLLVMFSVIFSF
eukprot:538524_1